MVLLRMMAAAAIVASLVPVVFGIAFLVSVLIHRPLMAMLARRWPSLSGGALDQESPRIRSALSRVSTVWGVVLLAVGLLQGVGAMVAGLSITSPTSVAVRTLFALAVLTVMSIGGDRPVAALKAGASSLRRQDALRL